MIDSIAHLWKALLYRLIGLPAPERKTKMHWRR